MMYLLSSFDLNSNLRRYISDDFRRDTLLSLVLLRGQGRRAEDEGVPAEAAGCRQGLTLVHFSA